MMSQREISEYRKDNSDEIRQLRMIQAEIMEGYAERKDALISSGKPKLWSDEEDRIYPVKHISVSEYLGSTKTVAA
jgi:hypothetical protein